MEVKLILCVTLLCLCYVIVTSNPMGGRLPTHCRRDQDCEEDCNRFYVDYIITNYSCIESECDCTMTTPKPMPADGAPVPNDKAGYQDSVADASETGEDAYDDGDDSDMYMEPGDAEGAHTDTHAARQVDTRPEEQPPPPVVIVSVKPEQSIVHVTKSLSRDQVDDSSQKSEKTESAEKNLETESQNFFPSFAELFGNHRLPYTEHQQRYRPSRFLGYLQRDRQFQAAASTNKDSQPTLLGSGNFGVITGGTYYPEEKDHDEYNIDQSFSPYYHETTRTRSSYYKNPKPQPLRAGDFFANFRDFADITAPPKSSFSHLSVVYANKNGSSAGRDTEQPRNIMETLRMLEEEGEFDLMLTTTEVPQKKLSKSKLKLMKMKNYQEEKARKSRMTVEPLLALS